MKKIFLAPTSDRPRGLMLAMTLFVTFLSAALVTYLSLAVSRGVDNFKLTAAPARQAAEACIKNVDDKLAGMASPTLTCNPGENIVWSDMSCTSDTGSTDVLEVGDCSCTATYLGSGADSYSIQALGICPKGDRSTGKTKVYAAITADVSACQTCAAICPTPGLGATCVTDCGTTCSDCCGVSAACNPVSKLCE